MKQGPSYGRSSWERQESLRNPGRNSTTDQLLLCTFGSSREGLLCRDSGTQWLQGRLADKDG